MNIKFWKMHGAANDFILIDDRAQRFPETDSEWIREIAARRTGIGCEGLILIQPSESSDFRMRFFNPDGSEVEMCGNGARCIARLAFDIGAAPGQMTIETVAGQLNASIDNESVVLGMTEPHSWTINRPLALSAGEYLCSSVNTGVPHAAIVVDDLDSIDIQKLGSEIRYHQAFSPAGTNANFLKVLNSTSISVRTYERGVEAETMACGTGLTASALVAAKLGLVEPPVTVIPASGYTLIVDFTLTEKGAADVTLRGPAVYVFEGTLNYHGI